MMRRVRIIDTYPNSPPLIHIITSSSKSPRQGQDRSRSASREGIRRNIKHIHNIQYLKSVVTKHISTHTFVRVPPALKKVKEQVFRAIVNVEVSRIHTRKDHSSKIKSVHSSESSTAQQ